ncbi:MAG: ribonuclease HI [Alcaligenaceae bacterium]|nr:ribonuclease HI [Alcaligenaceae bacterium]
MTKVVDIWTDGACKGNPGVGGWGVLLRYGSHERRLFDGELETTNNRMEMMAVIQALNALTRPCHIRLHVDSTYVKNGMTTWIHNWIQKDWLRPDCHKIKNTDLWLEMLEATKRHQIEWIWVKGHAGDEGNEIADELANQGVQKVLSSLEDSA